MLADKCPKVNSYGQLRPCVIIKTMELSKLIQQITIESRFQFLHKLRNNFANIKIYLIGGIIRDALLNRQIKDYDFVVENIDSHHLENFLKDNGKIIVDSNIKTAVYKFLPRPNGKIQVKDNIIDIALPRREEYQLGGGHTPIKVITNGVTIHDDLSRRDFTMNALAVELFTPEQSIRVIDPFNGQSDIKKHQIRAVGNSVDRFLEDPLRILRAVRFACQLGFNIEKSTLKAIISTRQEINRISSGESRVSAERIQKELILSLKNPLYFFDLFDQTGLMNSIFPEIAALKGISQPGNWHAEGDAFTHTRLCLKNLPNDASIELILATLLHDIGKASTYQSAEETGDRIRFNNHDKVSAETAKKILQRLRFDNKTTDKVVWLVKSHMKLILDFPKMRLSKQKALILNPYFDDLIKLTETDSKSSLHPDKSYDLSHVKLAQKMQKKLRAEIEAGKPVEIINGNQIMDLLRRHKIDFDGLLVGKLKRQTNEAYADEQVKDLDQAKKFVLKLTSK